MNDELLRSTLLEATEVPAGIRLDLDAVTLRGDRAWRSHRRRVAAGSTGAGLAGVGAVVGVLALAAGGAAPQARLTLPAGTETTSAPSATPSGAVSSSGAASSPTGSIPPAPTPGSTLSTPRPARGGPSGALAAIRIAGPLAGYPDLSYGGDNSSQASFDDYWFRDFFFKASPDTVRSEGPRVVDSSPTGPEISLLVGDTTTITVPDAQGEVAGQPVVGSRTVLGEPATETRTASSISLFLQKGSIGVWVTGDTGATYDDLQRAAEDLSGLPG